MLTYSHLSYLYILYDMNNKYTWEDIISDGALD
jgi:hypothetical protein